MVQRSENSTAKTMLIFTIMMVVLPIFSYFASKAFIFEGLMGTTGTNSYFYAAIVAIAVVHVILGMFVYVAWTEESRPIPNFKAD